MLQYAPLVIRVQGAIRFSWLWGQVARTKSAHFFREEDKLKKILLQITKRVEVKSSLIIFIDSAPNCGKMYAKKAYER